MKAILYRIIAAFCFFTRLPFWRLANVPKEYYERVVPLWPLVGYLTAGVMVMAFVLTPSLPLAVRVLLTLVARLLVTGAIHEDGFADFCDGFGGGTNRQRILEIMKDSHIGTYGVLGLVLYYLLFYNLIVDMVVQLEHQLLLVSLLLLAADVFCKWVASTILYFLSYARKEEEAKSRVVYAVVPLVEKVVSFVIAMLPLGFFCSISEKAVLPLLIAAVAALLTAFLLFYYMQKRIQGYTGDCCGATFIICEVVFYLFFSLGG